MYRTGYTGDRRAEKPNRGLQGNPKISNNKELVTTPKPEGGEKKQLFPEPRGWCQRGPVCRELAP